MKLSAICRRCNLVYTLKPGMTIRQSLCPIHEKRLGQTTWSVKKRTRHSRVALKHVYMALGERLRAAINLKSSDEVIANTVRSLIY